MKLGAFSVSLAVKDIHASIAFYEKLGFSCSTETLAEKWVIMRNSDDQLIGLFEGMFPKNMLTFNPGWDAKANNLEDFDDVRVIQQSLIEKGETFAEPLDTASSGPAHFMIEDPDGNPILIDQHR